MTVSVHCVRGCVVAGPEQDEGDGRARRDGAERQQDEALVVGQAAGGHGDLGIVAGEAAQLRGSLTARPSARSRSQP